MNVKEALMASPVKQATRDDGDGEPMIIVTRLRSGDYAVSVIVGGSVSLAVTVPDERAVEQVLWEHLHTQSILFKPVQTRYTASPYRTSPAAKKKFSSLQKMARSRLRAKRPRWQKQSPHWNHEQFLHWLYFLVGQLLQRQQLLFSVEDLQPDWLRERERWLYARSVRMIVGLGSGLVFGLGFWFFTNQWVGILNAGLPFGLLTGLLFGLLCGLFFIPGTRIESVQRFKKFRMLAWLVDVLFLGMYCALFSLGSYGLSQPQTSLGWLLFIVVFASMLVFFPPVLLLWLPACLYAGPVAFVQPFLLRFFLWRTNSLPWHLVPFLEQATEQGLLRKVGGSYMLSQQLLRLYFDSLDKPIPPEITALEDTFTFAVFSFPPSPIAGKSATIMYHGWLAANATSITMRWGSNNWNDIINTNMIKQKNGIWQATITVPAGATVLNMAFHDHYYSWDNNGYSNYDLHVRNLTS